MARRKFVSKALEEHKINFLNEFMDWIDSQGIYHVHEIGEHEIKKFVKQLTKKNESNSKKNKAG